jgi:hypothetical protein
LKFLFLAILLQLIQLGLLSGVLIDLSFLVKTLLSIAFLLLKELFVGLAESFFLILLLSLALDLLLGLTL